MGIWAKKQSNDQQHVLLSQMEQSQFMIMVNEFFRSISLTQSRRPKSLVHHLSLNLTMSLTFYVLMGTRTNYCFSLRTGIIKKITHWWSSHLVIVSKLVRNLFNSESIQVVLYKVWNKCVNKSRIKWLHFEFYSTFHSKHEHEW